MSSYFTFKIIHQSKKSRARVGQIQTPHGVIDTPHFVPVATNACVKAVESSIVDAMNVQLLFCNTYHLLLHPGSEIIKKSGGLHSFMQRKKPIITDSGGFQVFSLAYGGVKDELKSKGKKLYDSGVVKITEEGVVFRSYREGNKILLTPESSVQAQKNLGADIIIPLDELPPYHMDQKKLQQSLDRTHRWEQRSLQEHKKNEAQQAMYAVIHGGINDQMRRESAQFLSKLGFDGFAIGGSLGKTQTEMFFMLANLMPHVPYEKPNHLLGIGDIGSIDHCIRLGIDTFDSSHPTKCARHGLLFTQESAIKIMQSKYKEDFEPIEKLCICFTCKHYTRAYIHHLFKAHELTAYTLATIHNLQFMVTLMNNYRQAILEDKI